MFLGDEREESLREVAALGNIKAVQHFVHAGVNVNSRNKMNGWTALHWAAHRHHENIVRLLLNNGADPSIKTNKDQTAADLGQKHQGILTLLTRASQTGDVVLGVPEPELPIVPTYLKNPDLEKTWLLPDEFSENKIENIVRQQTAASMLNEPSKEEKPTPAKAATEDTEDIATTEKEILVYLSARTDEALLGSVFLKNEPMRKTIETIREELDGLPDNFSLARHNGSVFHTKVCVTYEKIGVTFSLNDHLDRGLTSLSSSFFPMQTDRLPLLPSLQTDGNRHSGRIINVTHQIPYEITQQENSWSLGPRHGHSAMYEGIQSLENEWETIHVGWTGEIHSQTTSDNAAGPAVISSLKDAEKESLTRTLEDNHCIPLFLDSESVTGHYDGYCKTMLWPLLHYMIWNDATDGRLERWQWDTYASVNRKYADVVVQNYREGDIGCESTPDGVDGGVGHFCHVGTFPIGIDAAKVDERRKDPNVLPKIKAIEELYAGKKIVVARDKLDLVKGVLQKLTAFEKFLADYPQWRNKVVLIQLTDNTTNESSKPERKVSELVAHINSAFGSLEFTPIHHLHHHVQQDEYYALLSVADAALITTGRDGMNTTSLEYVVCQQQKHSPLILSELMGTSGSMGSAIMVNPWDYAGVAKAIHDALSMSEEEKKARQMGTLTSIRKMPQKAVPPSEMLSALETLCSDPKNEVWVISGRDEATLDLWLGHIPNLGLSAEHGSFMKYPGTTKWINLAEHVDMSWKTDVLEIFTYYTERTIGSFIEHKRCAITWHYRLADPEYGAFQAKECQNHLENAILSKMPVEVLVGKKNLEVRPKLVNKGEVVKRLLNDVDFCLCCGDDRTDEDMFKVVNKSAMETSNKFSIIVSTEDKQTQALWHLATVQDVTNVMTVMAESSAS
ncbi:threalose-6-phosphate phosphatase [Apophysomyces ossiformis]|uniref:Threalose-6-phosphate phosphatase n=1 Tax=Apophysomyces ossiformis TaxID=679940 RepID=A0A8H7BSR4_9FUNG|nr:threalose-6-phosphate phosphatase [Apophysomyces ossiformis]